MKIGYIGLGRMGKNMVLHLLEQGIEVVAWNRSPQPLEEVAAAGAIPAKNLTDLVNLLRATPHEPTIIWLMLPAGQLIDEFIESLIPLLQKDDLIIDGGNSFYKDSIKRGQTLAEKGVHFMDIGTSGGPGGARTGACLMIGGAKEDFERIKELAIAASAPNAYGHFGPIGAGHFAKMVHNGIEYGMMEAIGEGAAVLKAGPFKLDLAEIFRVYNNRSVIESRLVGWTQEALIEDPELAEISQVIGSTGEGEWTIQTAQELAVEVPVIKASFQVRTDSQKEFTSVYKDKLERKNVHEADNKKAIGKAFRNKVVSAMRGKFGQHQVNK